MYNKNSNQMKKVFLSLIICLLPISLFAEKIVVDGIFYNIYSGSFDAEVTETPNKYSGDIIIPETFSYKGNRYKVTSIGENAFRLCNDLSSVVIPNSVIQIEKWAFCDSENLKIVSFSTNLTSSTLPLNLLRVVFSDPSSINIVVGVPLIVEPIIVAPIPFLYV